MKKIRVNGYIHSRNSGRVNIPEAGLAHLCPGIRREVARRASWLYSQGESPQLVWDGKRGVVFDVLEDDAELVVEAYPLQVMEQVHPVDVMLRIKGGESDRATGQMRLFELPTNSRVDCYRHSVGWANRLILGDSLEVMASLLKRENMAGKVQMIYMDPPYGISFKSNWQPRIDRRDVKDHPDDFTREPKQAKVYRDTWRKDVHSYLSYLRDRLELCRELLAESGSIFVQINDEHMHLVRCLLDEVFRRENFVAMIAFRKTLPLGSSGLPGIYDILLWYAKNKSLYKYRQLFVPKDVGGDTAYSWIELPDGTRRRMTPEEQKNPRLLPKGAAPFTTSDLKSSGYTPSCTFAFEFAGKIYPAQLKSWRTNQEGMKRLIAADRLIASSNIPRYVQFFADFPVQDLNNLWSDTLGATDMVYVVQTTEKVIERCIHMTTDPGDLVFDPTCGSGTTAYCAEKWGRRWITCDTSRVALHIARQRLMTAVFDWYALRDPQRGPIGGFFYEEVPHLQLQDIARNEEIDAIVEEFRPAWEGAVAKIRDALGKEIQDWEIPRGAPPDKWPEDAKAAWAQFDRIRRERRKRIDESNARRAGRVSLYDRPRIERGRVRVSGPFTVESLIQPAGKIVFRTEWPLSEGDEALPEPELLASADANLDEEAAYVEKVLALLRRQEIALPDGTKAMAEDVARHPGKACRAAAILGGRVFGVAVGRAREEASRWLLERAEEEAREAGFDGVLAIACGFAAEAQAFFQERLRDGFSVVLLQIAPDAFDEDLRQSKSDRLLAPLALPNVDLREEPDGRFVVVVEGFLLYNPESDGLLELGRKHVAAWFLDSDYDGSFVIRQAFFCDERAWGRASRVLGTDGFGVGFESVPFIPGKQIAVKVVDWYGQEAMTVLPVLSTVAFFVKQCYT